MVLPVQGGRSVMLVFGACFHGTMHQKTVSLTDPPVYIVNTAFQFFTSDLEPKSYRSKISGLTNPIRLWTAPKMMVNKSRPPYVFRRTGQILTNFLSSVDFLTIDTPWSRIALVHLAKNSLTLVDTSTWSGFVGSSDWRKGNLYLKSKCGKTVSIISTIDYSSALSFYRYQNVLWRSKFFEPAQKFDYI